MENKSREGQYVRNKAHKIMHGIMVHTVAGVSSDIISSMTK